MAPIKSPEERARMRNQKKQPRPLSDKEIKSADRLEAKCEKALDEKNNGSTVMVDTHGYKQRVINEVIRRYTAARYTARHEYDERCFRMTYISRLHITPPKNEPKNEPKPATPQPDDDDDSPFSKIGYGRGDDSAS